MKKIITATVLVVMSLLLLVCSGLMVRGLLLSRKTINVDKSLKVFTVEELKKYNGSDQSLPIYLAYEGKIYDVSSGREYYKTGGVYHFLAGKDSTTELNMVGGAIIRRKYPVIGRLQ